MKHFKNLFSAAIILIAVISVFSCLQVSAETASNLNTVPKETLIKENGVWYYTVNGEKSDTTTLVKYYDTWYYVENGVVNFNATTLCKYYDTWYYVEKGKVNWSATTLCKYYDTWYYVEKGKVNWGATTLCKYYDTWYYVEKGKVNWGATTLCKYYDTWYYVEKGVVNFNATTLCKYGNTWYYIEKGRLNRNATTLCKYYDTWYYVEKGIVNFDATTLCKYGNTWYYIEKGRLNRNATTLCKYYDTWYYVEKGVVNFNATTLCKYGNTWYYIEKGQLNWSATTLCKYYNTWYYVQNGKVNFNATTSHKYYGTWYNVVNGVVKFNYSSTPAPNKVGYLNVGSGYIAEIVEYNAETFDGNISSGSAVDWSRPTNNYLPKGTIDYCSATNFKYDDITYATLRAGRRVYTVRQDKPYAGEKPVIKQYKGTLPNYNTINSTGFQNNGTHTVLTLDTSWKAPFYFDILPQSYGNPSTQNYNISSATFNYIDITFCYATGFSGNITVPDNSPIFKGSELIFNKNSNGTVRDITLRLFLKKQGSFYGWDSYYNEKGQLCFEFLNPKTITTANNEYGVNLNGAKILIDVGHGGIDPGALGKNSNEAQQNLILANKIKAELEKIGVKVYMTRTSNATTSSTDDKITYLKQIKPDYCIAIHHDSSTSSSANGFSAFYFNAFSANASNYVYQANKALTSIYKNFKFGWHYYYTCRTTNCPVVLTENGFMSNSYDYANITSDSANNQKAKAITIGIVNYFKSIQ